MVASSAEARAPRPLSLIVAEDEGRWPLKLWVGAVRRRLFGLRTITAQLCEVELFES